MPLSDEYDDGEVLTSAKLNAIHYVVVVTDPGYGAVGDGVTDDTAAINAAIAAANAAGGGIVVFPVPSVSYNHTALTLFSGVRLVYLVDFSPESVCYAQDGDIAIRTNGSESVWMKAGSTGTTGWVSMFNNPLFLAGLDIGENTGSPAAYLNKSSSGSAIVGFRQTRGADTDGDIRLVFDGSEVLSIQRRVSGVFSALLTVSAGAVQTNLQFSLTGRTVLTPVSPAALAAGATNDYAPGGAWPETSFLVLLADSTGSQLTGLSATGVLANQRVHLFNNAPSGSLTLEHSHANSLAANRFFCPNNVDFILPPRSGCTLVYVSTSWRILHIP